MLDFYLIPDSHNISSRGLLLEHIGSIEQEAFTQMQAAGIIEPWLDYYGKFRWGSELITRKQQQLHELLPVATHLNNFNIFAALLQRATQVRCGLLAQGD